MIVVNIEGNVVVNIVGNVESNIGVKLRQLNWLPRWDSLIPSSM
jgi:hypothetical protein